MMSLTAHTEKYVLTGGDCLEGQPLSYDYSVPGEAMLKPYDNNQIATIDALCSGIASSDVSVGSVVRVAKNNVYCKVRIELDQTLYPNASDGIPVTFRFWIQEAVASSCDLTPVQHPILQS